MEYETAQDLFNALCAPFSPEFISWRVGSTNKEKTKGMALAYVDARAVMDRLDSVCGPDGWQCRYPHVGGKTVCDIGIRMAGDWIWKSDGAGDSDVEAEKGALSDAFKRAAVRWGIARYLYDIKSPWVEIEPYGKSYKISGQGEKALADIYEQEAKRLGWGNPTDVATYRFLLRIVQETVLQPSDVAAFREKYKGMIPLLRVAMRNHLEKVLDQVGSSQEAA